MGKIRLTLTVDEEVLRWVKIRAARTGKTDGAVIEESLRRDLRLDCDALSEAEAMDLAVDAQHRTRPARR